MTRNDIKALFPDATKEAIDQLLDINSSDIGKAVNKGQTAQDHLEGQVASLNEQIKALTGQNKDLNAQVKALSGDIAKKDAEIKQLADTHESAINELTAQHEVDMKALKDQNATDLEAIQGQLKTAQARASVADTLTERVAQLTKDVADRDATIASNNKSYRIKDELRGLHAKNVDVIWPLLNLDKITETDGKLEGLAEQVEALQKSDAYLFDLNTGNQRGGVVGNPDVGNSTSVNDVVNQAIRALSGRN